MVGLLRALFSDSPVLILDEPTSSLDETSRDHVLRLVRLISQNKTLIIITHDPDLLAMVERVVHIEKGVIVQDEMLRAA
jgi:ABC-type bacteriocin/lantibiotic exporter with double-glycine peptidase domain